MEVKGLIILLLMMTVRISLHGQELSDNQVDEKEIYENLTNNIKAFYETAPDLNRPQQLEIWKIPSLSTEVELEKFVKVNGEVIRSSYTINLNCSLLDAFHNNILSLSMCQEVSKKVTDFEKIKTAFSTQSLREMEVSLGSDGVLDGTYYYIRNSMGEEMTKVLFHKEFMKGKHYDKYVRLISTLKLADLD